jgi:anti-sigma regulatory factor (Ser/Thr protein kinase)
MGSLSIPSNPAGFREIRAWLADVARSRGFDERQALDLALAVNEACANIHRHAYAGRRDGTIEFRLEMQGETLRIRIRDFGSRFHPGEYRTPDPDELSESGYGLFLIHSLMDEVEYVRKKAGTELRLAKHRRSGCNLWKGDGDVQKA